MQTKVLEQLPDEKFNAKKSYAYAFTKFLYHEYKLKGKVLDIGAGRGEYQKPFESIGLHYVGVDAEPEKDSIRPLDLTTGKMPFKDNIFDVVFMRYVIEHIEKGPNTFNALNEIKRVLKPGGKFILVTSDWYFKHKTFYDTFDHVSPYTQNSIKRLLEYSKFETITCRNYINIPWLWRYFPVFSFKHKLKCNGIFYIGSNVK